MSVIMFELEELGHLDIIRCVVLRSFTVFYARIYLTWRNGW